MNTDAAHNRHIAVQAFFGSQPGQPKDEWIAEEEGQLAIDVFETEKNIVIISTMAGADAAHVDVHVHSNDLLTIRGERKSPVQQISGEIIPVLQECFWGKFSRTIVLPMQVQGEQAHAEYKNGVLQITIPKAHPHAAISIEIIDE